MTRFSKLTACALQLALVVSLTLTTLTTIPTAAAAGQKADKKSGGAKIKTEDLKEWLSFLASDELEGRDTFSEGLGIAAAYLAFQLKSWGVKPGGTNGSYFQRVPLLGVKSDNKSSVTVEVNGQSRTFANQQGVSFPANSGGKRTFTAGDIEFLGYGLNSPDTGNNDYAGKNVKGKVVVWLGAQGPKTLTPQAGRVLFGRSREAVTQGAAASIGVAGNLGGTRRNPGAAGSQELPDFETVERIDKPVEPQISASDEFFDFLFSGADVKYAELKAKADAREPLPAVALKNVRITFNIDPNYRVVRTRYTRNVVGIVEGADARLKDTYVAFGAHYDHVGYSEGEVQQAESGARLLNPRGRVTKGQEADRVWNGADDDGSGTVGILAIAKAFATGPKPKRSLIFVWHTGEERGLWGSRYFADSPSVPLDKIVAQINIDMIGRNNAGEAKYANQVFVVGSDRISTELHNLSVDANGALTQPLELDYDMNDPSDPQQIYYRSDHYSYAAKGIPVVFLFTGIHPDYHANTDHVEKIEWEKMTRIAQYAYEVGARVANLDHAPARDNKGPRVGKTVKGKLPL